MRSIAMFISALGLALSAGLVEAQGIPANSTWLNQRGSTLQIKTIDSSTGVLHGEYINRATGFDCQNTPYDVIGWVEGDKVAFAVRWKNSTKDCKAITSWTGYLERGVLVTDWDLAYTDSGLGRPTLMRGTDMFKKQ